MTRRPNELLAVPAVTQKLAGFLSGLDIRYAWGEGHPLVGRRMPNISLGERDVFSHMHAGRPLLVIFDDAAVELPASHAARIDVVHAKSVAWRLPVVGDVAAPPALLVRPDGYVAWAGGTSLSDVLTRWF